MKMWTNLGAVALALLLGLALNAQADTIERWRGEPITDATIRHIHEGYLYYVVNGEQKSLRLTEVKSIVETAREPARTARVTTFRDFTRRNDEGKLLGIAVNVDRGRIHEPLVRLYVMEQDPRGQRQVNLYQNHRGARDPSRLEDIPIIAANSYHQRYFFAPVDSRAIAYRLEIWVQGELLFATDSGQESIGGFWWRTAERLRTSILTSVEATEVEASQAPEEEDDGAPDVAVQITRASLQPQLGQDTRAIFTVSYRLTSNTEPVAPLPSVRLIMVLIDRENRQLLRRVEIDDRSGEEVNLEGQRFVRRELNYELPRGITGNSANMRLDKDLRYALAAWRVRVHYDSATIAVKQGGDSRALALLRDEEGDDGAELE